MNNQKFVIINGDMDIDYYDVYGPFDSIAEAEEALKGFEDGEELYGENMVRVIPLSSPESLLERIAEEAEESQEMQ